MLDQIGSWFVKVDPTVVLLTVTTLGGWLWRKMSGETTQRAGNIIDAVIDNFLLELLDVLPDPDPSRSVSVEQYLKGARAWMEERAWKVLAKRGVKKTAATSMLVHAAIERASASLGKRVQARRDAAIKAKALAEAGGK